MNEFYKMDIFFVVTTAAVILLAILLAIVLVYVIKIMNDIKYISGKAKNETDKLSEDMDDLRAKVRTEGLKFSGAYEFFQKILKRHKK